MTCDISDKSSMIRSIVPKLKEGFLSLSQYQYDRLDLAVYKDDLTFGMPIALLEVNIPSAFQFFNKFLP